MMKKLVTAWKPLNVSGYTCSASRSYALCCRPRPPPPGTQGGCPPIIPGGKRIQPPPDCSPGPIPPNPCVPIYHHGGPGSYKIYKRLALFVCFPLIFIQAIHALVGHEHEPPPPCRDYEYMRIRNRKYAWGDGNKTFFHNDHVNKLPGDCEPPLLDCD